MGEACSGEDPPDSFPPLTFSFRGERRFQRGGARMPAIESGNRRGAE